jgi:hypothetical protein
MTGPVGVVLGALMMFVRKHVIGGPPLLQSDGQVRGLGAGAAVLLMVCAQLPDVMPISSNPM